MADIVDRLRTAETAPLDADGKVALFLALSDARAEIVSLRQRVAVLELCAVKTMEVYGNVLVPNYLREKWAAEGVTLQHLDLPPEPNT